MFNYVKEYKDYYLCYCPSHNDKHASALLFKDSGMLKCMSCGYTEFFSTEDFQRKYDPSFVKEEIKYYNLSGKALEYIYQRNINTNKLPSYVVSDKNNDGVGFLQTEINGKVIGLTVRLFNPISNNMRYIFYGQKGNFTGSLDRFYGERKPIIAFEKTFAALKTNTLFDDCCAISTNGKTLEVSFWRKNFIKSDIVFLFDNDDAGIQARDKMRRFGFHAFITLKPSDELSDNDLRRLIDNAKSILLR